MSQRIAFRDRASGKSWPRIEFVKGWLTGGTDPEDGSEECGDGTFYPLKVTWDQLEEILYRVRDSWFISGRIKYSATELVEIANPPPIGDNLSNYIDLGSGRFTSWIRGYSTSSNLVNHGGQSFGEPYDRNGTNFRDAIKEAGMWSMFAPRSGLDHFIGSRPISDFTEGTYDLDGNYGAGGLIGTFGANQVSLSIFPGVAFTGDDIRDTDGDFYLSCFFEIFGNFDAANPLKSVSYDNDFEEFLVPADINLKIELSKTEIEIPLYRSDNFPTPDLSSEDFVIKAFEWWPYATTNGDPAWDSTTGEPINSGPGS
jgi:hypothetical protein